MKNYISILQKSLLYEYFCIYFCIQKEATTSSRFVNSNAKKFCQIFAIIYIKVWQAKTTFVNLTSKSTPSIAVQHLIFDD